MGSTAFGMYGPWKLILDMGSSSHWGLILVRDQEADEDSLGKSFRSSVIMVYCNIRIAWMRRI